MSSRKRVLVAILVVVCVASSLTIYYVAPFSTIKVKLFNTRSDDTAKFVVFMDGKEKSVVHFEPYSRINITYHVAAGTHIFSFAWRFGSDTSQSEYTHYVGISPAAYPPFEAKVGHFDSETIYYSF